MHVYVGRGGVGENLSRVCYPTCHFLECQQKVCVGWSQNAPSSVCSDVEFPSAEGICYVGFAGYSVEHLMELALIVPCPMGADQVVEWLVFASSFEDGMFGCFVVAQLYVRCGKHRFKQDRGNDGRPCFEKVNECL